MQRATSLGIDEQVSNFIFLTQRLQHLTTHTHMFVDFVKKKRFRLPDCPFEKNINHRRLRQTNKTTRACCLLLLWLSGGERNKLVEYCIILCMILWCILCAVCMISTVSLKEILFSIALLGGILLLCPTSHLHRPGSYGAYSTVIGLLDPVVWNAHPQLCLMPQSSGEFATWHA